jgi:predicted permease
MAVRLALGASRGRLVRQMLTESTLLAAAGGILGMLPALWPLRFSMQMRPPADLPIHFEVDWDYRVLLFGFLVTLLTGLVFGLLPALNSTKSQSARDMKGLWSASRGRGWVWNSLIALQVAASLVLLTLSGLMLGAMRRAGTIELGFEPRGAVEVGFDLGLQGYDATRGLEIMKQIVERVRALPGVRAAGLADLVPVDLHFSSTPIFLEGAPEERVDSAPRSLQGRISPGYLAAMQTRLVGGRDFSESDIPGSEPVAIVNQAFARRFWPGQDALDKRFRIDSPRNPLLRVVGVVQDGKYSSLAAESRPIVYRALWQTYAPSPGLIVRSDAEPHQLIAAVRREIVGLDAHLPLNAAPLGDRLALALLPARITSGVLSAFALLGMALAAIGIYGVISYSVSRRTRELGIRMALGASKLNVLWLVIGEGVRPALFGALLGVPATIALTRLMTAFLYGFSATDPLTYVSTAALLAGVAVLASYLPARRATRVDPVIALREE